MLAALREAGCRITRQRTLVIDYLADRDDHPSASQVHAAVVRKDPGISLTTVYNTLATLVHTGQVTEIDFDDDHNRYDTNLEPHLNLVCSRCGSISDLALELPVRPSEVESATGFVTTAVRLEYRGMCSRCGDEEAMP
jgi:Fur family peroxide stress response transcriptional regulator